MNPLRSIITRILPKAWFSPYEAANHSPRRGRVPGAAPRDAKLDLLPGTRRELVRRSRYLHKNSGFVRELVGSMAIYATGDGIKPQALSPSPEWNKAAEEYFARWAARCEVTSRAVDRHIRRPAMHTGREDRAAVHQHASGRLPESPSAKLSATKAKPSRFPQDRDLHRDFVGLFVGHRRPTRLLA